MSNISELLEIGHNGVKAPVNDAVLTGDVRFPTTDLTYDNSIATTEFTRNAIKSLTTYYKEPMVYQQIATNGAAGTSLIFDASGNLYWAMSNFTNGSTPNLTSYVYKITPAGTITTFASQATAGATATKLLFDASGNLYWAIACQTNGSVYTITSYVYKITSGGSLTTFASVSTNAATSTDLIFDTSGNLYWAIANQGIATSYNATSYVYKITSGGSLTTFASQATIGATDTSLVFDNAGNLYWAIMSYYNGTTYSNMTSYVYKITTSGVLSTFASQIGSGSLSTDLVFDSSGNLYWVISNHYNGTTYNLTSYIYKITTSGVMTTFVTIATSGGHRTRLIFDTTTQNFYWSLGQYYNGTTYSLSSNLYKIDLLGNIKSIGSQSIFGNHANDIILDTNKNIYWALNNHYNGTTYSLNSFIYRLDKQSQ